MSWSDKAVSPVVYTPGAGDASGMTVPGGLLLKDNKLYKPANPSRTLIDPALYGDTFKARMKYFYELHAANNTFAWTKKNATSTNKAYVGAVPLADGRVVFGCYSAAGGISVFDPVADSLTIYEAGNASLGTCVGGVLHPNGKAYFIRNVTTANVAIQEFDPATNTVRIWGTMTNACYCIVAVPDGRLILIGNGTIYEANVDTRSINTSPGYTNAAYCASTASAILDNISGDIFVWVSWQQYVARINTTTRVVTRFTKPSSAQDSYCFACDLQGFGYFFSYVTPFGVVKINLETQACETLLALCPGDIRCMTLAPNGRLYGYIFTGANAAQMIEFNPYTGVITAHSTDKIVNNTQRSFAIATNGKIYFAPYNAFNVYEVDLGVGSDFDWNIHGSIYGKAGSF